jgi:glycosyltransferase involved in cell wall biosynthesis
MPSVAVFSISDIGGNFRLLKHAKSFSRQSLSQVFLIGPDGTSLPKDLECAANVRVQYLSRFVFPFPFNWILGPFSFLALLVQSLYIFLRLPHVDLLLASTGDFQNSIIAIILSGVKRCKLAFDIVPFTAVQILDPASFCAQRFEHFFSRIGHIRIVSTRSMQIIMEMRHVSSFLIRDVPGTLFRPQHGRKSEIARFLGVDSNCVIISIPLPDFRADQIDVLAGIARQLDRYLPVKTVWVVFGNSKGRKSLETQLKEVTFTNVLFKDFGMYTDAYSQIMGASDFGICFVGSHHGLDVSSELVAMATCQLPVLVFKYGCVAEYVKDGETGFYFNDESSLLELLKQILIERSIDLEKIRQNCAGQKCDWDEGWNLIFGKGIPTV